MRRDFQTLRYERVSDTATIEFCRPDVKNAFNRELYRELRDAVRLADADDAIEFVVITGGGGVFSSGGDLRDAVETIGSSDPLELHKFSDVLPWDALRECRKTTIAAVRGYCLGGATLVALLCDLSIASENAIIGLPEAKVGVAASIVSSLLFGRVPACKAKYLMLTGASLSARDAERYGLVGEVAPEAEFDDRLAALANELRLTAPHARQQFKQYWDELIPRQRDSSGATGMGQPQTRERIQAFLNRKRT